LEKTAMPRLVNRDPAYKLHKPTGRGRSYHEGKDVWFPGSFNSPQSLRGYADFIDRLKSGDGGPASEPAREREAPPNLLTVAEPIERFWVFAQGYYRQEGNKPTGEAAGIRCALRPLLNMFGDILAANFKPSDLETVRDEMIRRALQACAEHKLTSHPHWPSFTSDRGRSIRYGSGCCSRTTAIHRRFAGITLDWSFSRADADDIIAAIRKVYPAVPQT
jgi:hypothetical protein